MAMQKKLANVPKKKYQTPSLTIHGTVQKLTEKITGAGSFDSPRTNKNRTHA